MPQNNKIEERVMADIKSGKVKLRSRYIFLAEKFGLSGAFAFSVILAALFFNLTFFYLKASDNLFYLSFGSRGVFAFLESFPYLLVVSLIIAIFIAGVIIKKADFSYKKPFGYLAVGLILLAMVGGGILTFARVAERIEENMFQHHPSEMFFRPFLSHGLDERQRGLAGRINEVGDGYIIIQTPRDTVKIDLGKLEKEPDGRLAAGLFVIAVGEKKGDIFEAQNIHIVNENEMPMIRHGVHDRFGNFMPPPPANERALNCQDSCQFDQINSSTECAEKCLLR